MCPVTGTAGLATAQLVVSGASAAAGVASSVMATNAENEANAQTRASARDSYILKTTMAQRRIQQTQDQHSRVEQDASLKRMRAQGKARASAAAGGVSGSSYEQLLQDYERSEALFVQRKQQEMEGKVEQISYEQSGFEAEAQNRINSAPPVGMEKIFGATMGAGAQMFGAYKGYSKATTDTSAPE